MRRHLADTRVWLFLALLIVSILTLAPLVWMAAASLRPSAEIFASMDPPGWSTFFPSHIDLSSLTAVLTGPLLRATVNSLIVTFVTVALGLVINSMAAFALSVLQVKGRAVVFTVVVLSFMVPFDAVAIPLAEITRSVGLDNTYLALILPGVGNGLAIFLLRQFFLGVPISLAEAARLDGANMWIVYRRIYLPLSSNAMIGAGLILFLFQWQAYMWPLLVTSDPTMDVGAISLARLFGQYGVDWGVVYGGATLLTIIPTLVVLYFQRQLIGSLATAGTKG